MEVLKVYIRKHVAVRKEGCFPGVKTGEIAEPGNILACVETKHQQHFYTDGYTYDITLYRLQDGRGWIHDFNPANPKLGGILTVLGTGVRTSEDQEDRVYELPLIYFDSSHSLLKDMDETPTQFSMPDKKMYLGASKAGASKENEKCMVYSLPTTQVNRRARVGWNLILLPLFFVDLLLVVYAYIESVNIGRELNTWDLAALTCTTSTLLLGLYGVIRRNAILLMLFSLVFTIDMAMSILNIVTMWHSVTQIAIFYFVGLYRKTLESSWTTIHPRHRS